MYHPYTWHILDRALTNTFTLTYTFIKHGEHGGGWSGQGGAVGGAWE